MTGAANDNYDELCADCGCSIHQSKEICDACWIKAQKALADQIAAWEDANYKTIEAYS